MLRVKGFVKIDKTRYREYYHFGFDWDEVLLLRELFKIMDKNKIYHHVNTYKTRTRMWINGKPIPTTYYKAESYILYHDKNMRIEIIVKERKHINVFNGNVESREYETIIKYETLFDEGFKHNTATLLMVKLADEKALTR